MDNEDFHEAIRGFILTSQSVIPTLIIMGNPLDRVYHYRLYKLKEDDTWSQ